MKATTVLPKSHSETKSVRQSKYLSTKSDSKLQVCNFFMRIFQLIIVTHTPCLSCMHVFKTWRWPPSWWTLFHFARARTWQLWRCPWIIPDKLVVAIKHHNSVSWYLFAVFFPVVCSCTKRPAQRAVIFLMANKNTSTIRQAKHPCRSYYVT